MALPIAQSTGSTGGSASEIEEEPAGSPAEDRVYVAVGKEVKEGRATLLWALHNMLTRKEQTVVVVAHVHRPPWLIPMLGGKFPASQVKDQEVRAYRRLEREKMHKKLDEYLIICSQQKVRAEKLVVEMDDVGEGLVDLIAEHRVTKIVMGAAADKHYSKKMKVPKSKTAIRVKQDADSSCKIWFVCKGHLICTRETCLDTSGLVESSVASPSSVLTDSVKLSLGSPYQGQSDSTNSDSNSMHDSLRSTKRHDTFSPDGKVMMASLPPDGSVKASFLLGRFSSEGSSIDQWDLILQQSYQNSESSSCSASNDMLSSPGSQLMLKDEGSEENLVRRIPSMQKSDDHLQFSTPDNELEDMALDDEVYDRLQKALTEAENLKCEAYQELRGRQKAERDAIEALRKVKAAENFYVIEVRQRKGTEVALARGRLELEVLRKQQEELLKQLQKSNEQKRGLELHISDSDNIVKELEQKLSEAQHLLDSLQLEHEELETERDGAVREAQELRHEKEQMTTRNQVSVKCIEFSYSELEQATCGFSSSLKIGEGSYGSVFKGFLRNTSVAIKILNPGNRQGQSEFHQEVDILGRVRHPNLVTLIGLCSQVWALIYEYLPQGSLEDRLARKNNTPPLTWPVRTCIATEICSALIFLHSHSPHPIVHGDLKPGNILLDNNFVSKLGDFGTCRLLTDTTTTVLCHAQPKGTFGYIDPEFLSTGVLAPHSDIYSLGITILQLISGRPVPGIVKEIHDAVDKGHLKEMIDVSAGNWPFLQASELAKLGLRCCELNPNNRPDLAREAWPVLKDLQKAASLSMSTIGPNSDERPVPSYFVCPVLQEIMRDPQIAADGFTYEAVALKEWFESGHDTSPMTNLKLPHCNLIPNRGLRSAIQEWSLEQQQLL